MSVPAPSYHPVQHTGLQGLVSNLNSSIAIICNLDKDSAAITDPSVPADQKAAAYLDLSNLAYQMQNQEGQQLCGDLYSKLTTYLQSVVITPQHAAPNSDIEYPNLRYGDRDATLYDIVEAVNLKDVGHNFSIYYPSADNDSWIVNSPGNCQYDAQFGVISCVHTDITDILERFLAGSTTESTNPSAYSDLKAAIEKLNN